jgi:hypothetical protein
MKEIMMYESQREDWGGEVICADNAVKLDCNCTMVMKGGEGQREACD